jgi:hypothetical protein
MCLIDNYYNIFTVSYNVAFSVTLPIFGNIMDYITIYMGVGGIG